MARIIAFPKIHPRFRAPPSMELPLRNWPAWGVALLACVVAAPSCLALAVIIVLVPPLWWLLVVDVLFQLARIVFVGGMAAVHGLLHLAALGVLTALVISLAGEAKRHGGEQGGQQGRP